MLPLQLVLLRQTTVADTTHSVNLGTCEVTQLVAFFLNTPQP